MQARRGDGWVKLVGDWIDRGVGDLAPEWPADAVAAAIAAAHEEGARVTAHTFGTDALPALIDAGIDCIEHGTGLTEELIGEMAARGTAVVPTLVNVANFPEFAAAGEKKFPAYAEHDAAAARAVGRRRARRVRRRRAGVRRHRRRRRHRARADRRRGPRACTRAGLPAEAALGAASWARAVVARAAVHRGGRAGRRRRLRRRPAGRPRRAAPGPRGWSCAAASSR